jgi:predicted transcriptional regulator
MASQPYGRSNVANQNFDPTKRQRRVLDVFRQEYQVNPRRIREATGIKKQRVNDELDALMDAGWVEKRTRGLYRLVYNGECYVEQTVHCKDDTPRRGR